MAQVVLNAAVAVDLVVLTIRDEALCALVVRRGIAPCKGAMAVPGGLIREGEALDKAAVRELEEETGLRNLPVHLEQLATYGDPSRDPRGRVITVAYLALAPDLPRPVVGSDAAAARWTPVSELVQDPKKLAFDHHQILADGVERARGKLEYTPLGAAFCPTEFTIAELRKVYEIVWGTSLDPRNFHRKATTTPGFVEAARGRTTRDGGRPAQLYRMGRARTLYPPLTRPARHNTLDDARRAD